MTLTINGRMPVIIIRTRKESHWNEETAFQDAGREGRLFEALELTTDRTRQKSKHVLQKQVEVNDFPITKQCRASQNH